MLYYFRFKHILFTKKDDTIGKQVLSTYINASWVYIIIFTIIRWRSISNSWTVACQISWVVDNCVHMRRYLHHNLQSITSIIMTSYIEKNLFLKPDNQKKSKRFDSVINWWTDFRISCWMLVFIFAWPFSTVSNENPWR